MNSFTLSSRIGFSVAFMDADLPDLDCLYATLPEGMRVHWLDSYRDGMVQMAEVLAEMSEVKQLHVITHGAPG